MERELDKLYDLINDIEIGMLTTRRPDGHLESRAMATQKRAAGADLWFVSAEGTAKIRDLVQDRWLWFVDLQEHRGVDRHTDEHHARVVGGAVTRIAFLGEPDLPVGRI